MTNREFNEMVDEMHKAGLDDDKIMEILYETFKSGKCSIEDYELMVGWLGFELTDEFYKEHGIKRSR